MLSLLLVVGLAPASVPFPAPTAPQASVDLGSEIRTSIRWLRSAQDLETGAYAGSLEATALCVIAFAECPDQYRAVDGPFVRKALEHLAAAQRADGALCASGASGEVCRRATALAAIAFRQGDGGHAEALSRAREWLRENAAEPAEEFPYGLELGEASAAGEDAGKLASALLAEREADGSWAGPRGRVVETATRTITLIQLARIQSSSSAKGAPRPVESLPAFTPKDRKAAVVSIERGVAFLSAAADEKGRFGAAGHPDAGLTAMALSGLQTLPVPRPAELQAKIDQGLAWLVSLQHEDGSIHDGKLANYITSAAILALSKARRDQFAPLIARAGAFLRRLQNDEEEGYSEGDLYYGGIGYGSTERPDLSNLQMALEALHATGGAENAGTYAKALHFLQRTQNRSESSDLVIRRDGDVIKSGDDGGAAYLPGESKAGFVTLADGTQVPRSYGSMTYALLKCYLFAGIQKDDPRLQAAWEWCRSNYTLDVNPGFQVLADPTAAYQGLFYYFLTLARALEAYGVESVETPDGGKHAWRAELCGRLVAMQSKADGSWLNANSPRWYEGNPVLATAYALLSLETALPASGR